MDATKKGTFEYLEAKIRRDAEGTLFGSDFEWICQWFLENAPLYRGKFRHVWRWADWPDRWGPDCGIDLIAETRDGHLWAVQSKAFSPDHSVTKAEIDSFLSESNHRKISFRLLIATTDKIGANAKRTIQQQEKPASFVGRGDLLTAEVAWPVKIGGKTPRPKKANPKPHQRAAINSVARGFREHNRGRLIMACGTGKTLTGLWIHERLESRRTLLLVPSISLAQQNLREWGKHAKQDFDCLVVCSDASVERAGDDPAFRHVSEIGTDVTTDPAEIAAFLSKRRRRPAVVITTYHSSDRVAAAQQKARKTFDLALCDEAHRLVGDVQGKFTTVLDDNKVRCRRRLFMTATPRYFTDRAKRKAADAEVEVASMDDEALFGPEFHVLSFRQAMETKPEPLLTDYRVVVIVVTDAEAKKWVDEGKLVRTKAGMTTDARTLAKQIGLAKAMRDYDLRRVITFHRSIARASQFADPQNDGSLPSVINTLRPSSRPSGQIWSRHISGETPASQRASLLRALADLPDGNRGLIANCACLSEGVDVPALDGIAFIDPKGSMVDIIQAVGRVIRLSANKTVGTIVIPVFIDETRDPDKTLQQSQFSPVWRVLKALRAHDKRLADELDRIRLKIETHKNRRIQLPSSIVFTAAHNISSDFEHAFYVQAITKTTTKPDLAIEQILDWADAHHHRTGTWPTQKSGNIPGTSENWSAISQCLRHGLRSLPGGDTLSRLLARRRNHQPSNLKQHLTYDNILAICDQHYSNTGNFPTVKSGYCKTLGITFRSLDATMSAGCRGLTKRISLAQLLASERGKRNPSGLPNITEDNIKTWIMDFRNEHGRYPKRNDGRIASSDETWQNVSNAMLNGLRGLTLRMSLKKYIATHFDVGSKRSDLQLLKWCDQYFTDNGTYPNSGTTGPIPGTNETWQKVISSAMNRSRGFTKTLPQLLAEHRGVQNVQARSLLSRKKVIEWAQQHRILTGEWPRTDSGPVPGTAETWRSIHTASKLGRRGLTPKRSLAQFLTDELSVPYRLAPCELTLEGILSAADAFNAETGRYPKQASGYCEQIQRTWQNVDLLLRRGTKLLAGKQSLSSVLNAHRGVPTRFRKDLTVEQIIAWIRQYHMDHGKLPSAHSGEVPGTDETFIGLDRALRAGTRNLPSGWSIARIVKHHLPHLRETTRS